MPSLVCSDVSVKTKLVLLGLLLAVTEKAPPSAISDPVPVQPLTSKASPCKVATLIPTRTSSKPATDPVKEPLLNV